MKIEIKNLEKVFRTDTVETMALNKVSFTIGDGEFVAIMGPSGCGKSTLLNILGLLDNPTAGSYRLDDMEVGRLRESERTEWRKGRIGFVFQSFNLIEDMTVRDNIMLPLNNLKLDKAEKRRRVDEALRRMGISHRAGHYPSQLSGGQQQRVAIARAIVGKPRLQERRRGDGPPQGPAPGRSHHRDGDAFAARRSAGRLYHKPVRRTGGGEP